MYYEQGKMRFTAGQSGKSNAQEDRRQEAREK